MKLLVLSDIHLINNRSESKLEHFNNILQDSIKQINPDFSIFCGDILDKGSGDYENVLNSYLTNIGLNKSKVFISCGNHDINESSISQMYRNHVDGFKTNKILDDFYNNKENVDYISSLNHIKVFNNYVKKNYPNSDASDLFYIKKVKMDGIVISVVSINTCWFYKYISAEHTDSLFPVSAMYEIVSKIKDSSFSILVSHFPIENLKEFNRIEIDKLISQYFNVVISGHIHRVVKSSVFSSGDGYFKCSTPSMVKQDNPEFSGFLELDIHFDNYKVDIHEYNLFDHAFVNTKNSTEHIPVNEEKRQIIKINKALRNIYENELENANNKFVLYNEENFSFHDIFNEPIIRTKRDVDALKNNNSRIDVKGKRIYLKDITNKENYLIYGNDKSGKTMLLTKVVLDYFSLSSSLKIIPIYIDMANIYLRGEKLKLKSHIKAYINISEKSFKFINENYHIKIIMDNFKPNQVGFNNQIFNSCTDFNDVSFIFTVKNTVNYSPKVIVDHLEYKELFIHNINRCEVRELTNKWPLITENKKEDVFNKIIELFSQLNIHFNYWTVSMFLWIFEKTSDIHIHNDVELLDIYIENLLERSSLALQKSSFSYDNLKDFLGFLSHYLYKNCEIQGYSISYSELIKVYDNFSASNIRIMAESKDIVDYLVLKGVLVANSDHYYTFRLNGVLEYFIAHYMNSDNVFFKTVITNSELFLSFENELQIYAGLNRGDSELLQYVFLNTLTAHDKLIESNPQLQNIEESSNYQHFLTEAISNIVSNNSQLVKPLENVKKDEINDLFKPIGSIQSGVHIKTKYKLKDIDVELFNKHIFILSRVLRNSDSISDEKLIKEVFKYIVEISCRTPKYLQLEMKYKEELFPENFPDEYFNFLESYTPIITHAFLYDGLGHRNMKSLILDLINKEKKEPIKNPIKLFALLFLIIEADLENEMDLLDETIDLLHEPYIQHSLLLKLLMLMYFKVSKDNNIEKIIRKHIIKVNQRVNPGDKGTRILQNIDKKRLKRSFIGNQ